MADDDILEAIQEATKRLRSYVDNNDVDVSSAKHKSISKAVNDFYLLAQRLPLPVTTSSSSGTRTLCPKCGQSITIVLSP
jgi:uncharacterized protein (UPF0212 family)